MCPARLVFDTKSAQVTEALTTSTAAPPAPCWRSHARASPNVMIRMRLFSRSWNSMPLPAIPAAACFAIRGNSRFWKFAPSASVIRGCVPGRSWGLLPVRIGGPQVAPFIALPSLDLSSGAVHGSLDGLLVAWVDWDVGKPYVPRRRGGKLLQLQDERPCLPLRQVLPGRRVAGLSLERGEKTKRWEKF